MKLLKKLLPIILIVSNSYLAVNAQYQYIKNLTEVSLEDIALVGGKNASLGELINNIGNAEIQVPGGFAITTEGYIAFLTYNNLYEKIRHLINQITDLSDLKKLQAIAFEIRTDIEQGEIPQDLAHEIGQAYQELQDYYNYPNCSVAVRSSATAEDLPDASFAGQQDTFLNVSGIENILHNYKKCLASLFTDRAIAYRIEKNFDHLAVTLSVGVQKMVRSDLGCSGVAFSIDTETGFSDAVIINASYGLGEAVVQGMVTPDEFIVHKPTTKMGHASIIKKKLGHKDKKMVFDANPEKLVCTVGVQEELQDKYSLTDKEIISLAKKIICIEQHYSQYAQYRSKKGKQVPVDVEWAKDGIDGTIYITQARPETVHAGKESNSITIYTLTADRKNLESITQGISIGEHISQGRARIIKDINHAIDISPEDIIITQMTDPDWVPIMRHAAGIITDRGGRTCHAAIVSRELGIPAIVGTQNATEAIKDGELITLDCTAGSTGFVYSGHVPFQKETIVLDHIPQPPVPVMVNLADPDSAFKVSQLPTSGIGLARLEFIISNTLKVHPMALLHPEQIKDEKTTQEIKSITKAYDNKVNFFIDQLACNIGMIAAAFYPRPVIVRMSDFKSNEYRNLIGGKYFEPEEENPMIGFRGASRYYHPKYKDAFALECAAIKQVRETMGLENVKIMIPFVRSLSEAELVIQEMKNCGLERNKNNLQIIMMCELPCNVILLKEFAKYFDGFSIGSNDLTQTTLGLDRDSELVSQHFNEQDPAVKKMLLLALKKANKLKKYIGICGQGPSDFPEFCTFLIENGISSLSFTPDTVIPFLLRYAN